MNTLIIFDLDDTLIDSKIYARMYHELVEELLKNLKISEIELQEIITKLKQGTGKTRPDSFELCRKLSATEIYYKVLEKYVRHTYMLKNSSIPHVFKKMKESGKKIGVVSNSQEKTINIFLDRFVLSQYVDFVESGNKNTVLFWVLLDKKHGFDKKEALIIDDSDEILKIANNAGLK